MKPRKTPSEQCSALLAIIERIEGLVDWHADVDADVNNQSPEDSHAHCNGLVLRECKKARDVLAAAANNTKEASSSASPFYTAFFRNKRGNNQLKAEVASALDGWGWRDKEQPDHRSKSEVWAFISGYEAANRCNGKLTDSAATGATKAEL